MNDYKELIEHPELCWDYIDRLRIAIEQLVKERDAAIATIPHKCWSCGKGYHTENGFECEETWYKGSNPNCLSWEWRGVQE